MPFDHCAGECYVNEGFYADGCTEEWESDCMCGGCCPPGCPDNSNIPPGGGGGGWPGDPHPGYLGPRDLPSVPKQRGGRVSKPLGPRLLKKPVNRRKYKSNKRFCYENSTEIDEFGNNICGDNKIG